MACGLFLLLMVATVMFFDLSQRANRKTDTHSGAYREGALALRHIREELKGIIHFKLLGPNRIAYDSPRWKDNHIVVDQRGLPAVGAAHELYAHDGVLERYEPAAGKDPKKPDVPGYRTNSRVFAHLGTGTVKFEPAVDESGNPLSNVLQVTVTVTRDGGFADDHNHSVRELDMKVGLPNEQFWGDQPILKW